MPRRKLTKAEKLRNRSVRLTDEEMKKLDAEARKSRMSQGRFIARWLATL
jgi:Zn-dependent M16 (insulinase) family peptidase